MKRILFFLLVSLLLFGVVVLRRGESDQFVIHRGINISMWLSQVYDEEPLRIRLFNELDAIFLKSVGFDHIRLPLDEERLWNEDGTRNSKTWKEMHQAIRWCDRHGLRVIADLHIVRSHHFNAEFDGGKNTLFTDPEAQVHFLDLWKQLAQELHIYPNRLLAYEILNEAEAPSPEDWNRLVNNTLAQIRESEPERTIVMGSNNWQIPETFPVLEVPENDPNLILSFHLYSPLSVTHYRASWVPMGPYDGEINYPGVPVDEAVFTQDYSAEVLKNLRKHNKHHDAKTQGARMQVALDVAQKHGLQLYCGEFGCFPAVPREVRLRWYRDAVGEMDAKGIAYAAWDYKGGFPIVDRDTHSVDWDVTDILTGKLKD